MCQAKFLPDEGPPEELQTSKKRKAPSTTNRTRALTLDELQDNFHLPINEVACKLGVCVTVLKQQCRELGIVRWPYRKVRKLDNMLTALKTSAPEKARPFALTNGEDERKKKIDTVKQTLKELLSDPNSCAHLKLGKVKAKAAAAAATADAATSGSSSSAEEQQRQHHHLLLQALSSGPGSPASEPPAGGSRSSSGHTSSSALLANFGLGPAPHWSRDSLAVLRQAGSLVDQLETALLPRELPSLVGGEGTLGSLSQPQLPTSSHPEEEEEGEEDRTTPAAGAGSSVGDSGEEAGESVHGAVELDLISRLDSLAEGAGRQDGADVAAEEVGPAAEALDEAGSAHTSFQEGALERPPKEQRHEQPAQQALSGQAAGTLKASAFFDFDSSGMASSFGPRQLQFSGIPMAEAHAQLLQAQQMAFFSQQRQAHMMALLSGSGAPLAFGQQGGLLLTPFGHISPSLAAAAASLTALGPPGQGGYLQSPAEMYSLFRS